LQRDATAGSVVLAVCVEDGRLHNLSLESGARSKAEAVDLRLSAVGWLQDLTALIASNAGITHAWAWLRRVDELLERESLTDYRVSHESDAVLALYIARKIAAFDRPRGHGSATPLWRLTVQVR
jgi:hypothetical protein